MKPGIIRKLSRPGGGKIIFLIIDGLGGLPGRHGQTALEAADTPQLDRLAAQGGSMACTSLSVRA